MKKKEEELLVAINRNLMALIQDQQRLIILLESLVEHRECDKK